MSRVNRWMIGMALAIIACGAIAAVLALYLVDARQETDVVANNLSVKEVELANERAAHQETRDDRDSGLEALMEERANLTETVGRLTRERNDLDESAAALSEQNSALRVSLRSLSSERNRLTLRNESLSSEVDGLTLANESLASELDRLTLANESQSNEVDRLLLNNQSISIELDSLREEIAIVRLAHDSIESLEALEEAQDAYADLAVQYCGSIGALSACDTSESNLAHLQEAYAVYLEAQSQARDQYCSYREAWDSFYQSEPTSRYVAVCGGAE